MKKKYSAPELEIILLSGNDIMTISNTGGNDDDLPII